MRSPLRTVDRLTAVLSGPDPAICSHQAFPAICRGPVCPGFLARWWGQGQDGPVPGRTPNLTPGLRPRLCGGAAVPLVPEGLAWRGRAVRIVGGGCRPLHALTLPRPVPRLAGFFQGWSLGGGLSRSPASGEWATVILRHIMFLTRKIITKSRVTPQTDAARNQPERGGRNDERGGRATPSHLVPAETGSGHGQARTVSAIHIAITAVCYNGRSQRYVPTFTSRCLFGVDFARQTLRSG